MKVRNKTIKSISVILTILVLIPSVFLSKPQEAKALVASQLTDIFTGATAGSSATGSSASVTQTSFTIKSFAKDVLKQIIMSVEKRLLAQMTKSTINWINTGFHGSPLFVQNPQSFFRDIGKYEVKKFVDATGYDQARYPFGKDFDLNLINSFKNQANSNLQYTLSKVNSDPVYLSNYRSNFQYGGWNGFLINTQFPQNNYVGYQILATDQIARKLDGYAQNNIQKVQTTLQQGMGFLAPKVCVTNPNYNANKLNEFKPPTFDNDAFVKNNPWDPPEPKDCTKVSNVNNADLQCLQDNQTAAETYRTNYYKKVADATASFNDPKGANSCPNKPDGSSGLEATTPGSVVANQITTAMGSNFRQTELGQALGSSMSAIFDALLNHFLDQGLNALTSTKNPKPQQDNWSYDGQSLDTSDSTNQNSWDAGPDEVIVLSDFKKQLLGQTTKEYKKGETIRNSDGTTTIAEGGEVTSSIGDTGKGVYTPGDIKNTETELTLIDNESETDPGINQMISKIWPKIRDIDMCVPGPDLGWEDRLLKESERNSEKLQQKANDQDGEKAAAAQLVYKDLQYAVNSYKDWVRNKMIMSLPSSVLYMDEVDKIDSLYQQAEEVANKKKTRKEAFARLSAISSALEDIKEDPAPGSDQAQVLVKLKKQYNAIQGSAANSNSIEETRNDLAVLKERFDNLSKLLIKCNNERKTKGWSVPGGVNSTYSQPTTTTTNTPPVNSTEKAIFCDAPVKGGYPHGSFKNNGMENYPVTHPDLPLVNGQDVYKYLNKLTAIFSLGIFGHKTVNIQLSCNIIYNTSVVDYKQDLPGLTPVADTFSQNETVDYTDGTESGSCNVNGVIDSTSQQVCIDKNGTWTADNASTSTQ